MQPEAKPNTPLAALAESALEHILRQIPIDFWASTLQDNQIVFQSNLSIETWGNLQGHEIASLDIPTELIATLQENIDSALTGKVVEYETTLPVTTTRKRVYYNKISPIQDEKQSLIGVLGICRDVTEQREKEQLLIARRRLAERLNKASSCEEAFELCFETTLRISRIQMACITTVDEVGVGHFLFYRGIRQEVVDKIQNIKMDKFIRTAAVRGTPLIREPSDFHPEIISLLREQNVSEIAQFPICQNGQMIAMLSVASHVPERFPQWCIDELKTIVSQTETAIVRLKTQEKLEADRRLLRQLLKLQEQERHLISSEIHDGFVQEVVGAQMVLETLIQTCSDLGEECPEFFWQANEMLGRAIKEARRFISDLRPFIIEEAGIIEAVNFLINRFDTSIQEKIIYTHDKVIERFSPVIEGVAFRITQEGITNAVRYSEGTKIEIHLAENDGLLSISIVDDGIGFDLQAAIENSFGISGMIERASLFGGEAKIESKPGHGTKILVELPIIRMPEN